MALTASKKLVAPTTINRLVLLLLIIFSLFTATTAATSRPRPRPNLCAGVALKAPPSGGCHINCFRADPVCGANGVTYGCGCPEASCNGVRVIKLGPC
ncbi:unnamed protein product [Linum trigynum]|uniref:Kazal-like domain-containing protein n=1 Tax=Linum trigynum TaxID=586398 RepID=A0AAV2FLG5_9ROSI